MPSAGDMCGPFGPRQAPAQESRQLYAWRTRLAVNPHELRGCVARLLDHRQAAWPAATGEGDVDAGAILVCQPKVAGAGIIGGVLGIGCLGNDEGTPREEGERNLALGGVVLGGDL